MVFGEHFPFHRNAIWDMTTVEMIHYAKGAIMHYKMDMNQHAMSEDAESSIRKQCNELWDYMFPTTKKYAKTAHEQLNQVKQKHGFD